MDIKTSLKFSIVLFLIVAGIYFQVPHYGFIHYDDPEILVQNEAVKQFNLAQIFGKTTATDFIPLTLFSFALEHRVFGLEPWVYHFNNGLLYFLNCLLVMFLIWEVTRKRWFSFLVALLFAVHPLHVESVAWVTERKDVLSGFFALSGLLCYLKFKTRQKSLWLLACSVLFIMTVLSKPSLVVFPLLLLSFDYLYSGSIKKRDLLQKIPFFIISLVIIFIRLGVSDENFILEKQTFTLVSKITFAFKALVFYFSKILLPINLSVIYEIGAVSIEVWQIILTLLVLLVLGLRLILAPENRREIFFGLIFGFLSLLPVLQFIPFGNRVAFADRYSYFAVLGIVFSLAAAMPKKPVSVVVFIGVIAGFFILSTLRVPVWENDLTLWSDAYNKYPSSSVASNNFGLSLYMAGKKDEALPLLHQALLLDPQHLSSYVNLAQIYVNRGDFKAAEEQYLAALRIAPKHPLIRSALGQFYLKQGEIEKAQEFLK